MTPQKRKGYKHLNLIYFTMQLKIDIPNIKKLSDLKHLPTRLILFGETHGFLNDLKIQESLIKILKPKYYLYELLEDKSVLNESDFKNFLSKPYSKDFSIISTFGELKPTIKLAKKYDMKAIGIDLRNMGRANKTFLQKEKLTNKEKEFEKRLMNEREEYQAKCIKKYMLKDSRAIFVSLGAYHVRRFSRVLYYLKQEKFLLCYPTLKGKMELSPIKNMDEKEVIYKLCLQNNHLK